MPLDALFLSALLPELTESLKNGRIDQVYHPLKDRVVLAVRHPYPGREFFLNLSVHPQYTRLHITEEKQTNPLQPSAFCMLLRKHISGGRILSLEQSPWERVVTLWIEVYAAEKGLCRRQLILEAMGRRSNLLLLDEDSLILDALKRSTGERPVMPGETYLPPAPMAPCQPVISPLQLQTLLDRAPVERALFDLLRSEFMGISPFIAREWLARAGYEPDCRVGDLKGDDGAQLQTAFVQILQAVAAPNPTLLKNKSGIPVEFSSFTPFQPGFVSCEAPSLNDLVTVTLHHWDQEGRRLAEQSGIGKSLNERIAKLTKKLGKQQEELAQAEDADHYRIYGELLSVHASTIKKGQLFADLPNYYDPENALVHISLRPDQSPNENMQSFFKKYQKAKKGQIAIAQQIRLTKDEITYLEGILYTLTDPLSPLEIMEIQAELADTGYLSRKRSSLPKRSTPSAPRRFYSSEGVPIDVGRNNLQNDRLTLKISSPKDIWFHTQGVPGSHVLVRSDGQPFGDATLLEAANLAAWFSKSRASSKIPVDYTARRNVKKPPASRPGFVLYQPFQTIIVTPDHSLLVHLGVELSTEITESIE